MLRVVYGKVTLVSLKIPSGSQVKKKKLPKRAKGKGLLGYQTNLHEQILLH